MDWKVERLADPTGEGAALMVGIAVDAVLTIAEPDAWPKTVA
jgi:hypothetical protein